jgi:hypothetical protein
MVLRIVRHKQQPKMAGMHCRHALLFSGFAGGKILGIVRGETGIAQGSDG